jgi:group I intron endonuclease
MHLYRIVNTTNGRQYIGQSVEVEKRWRYHQWCLNNNLHRNIFLQRAWKKYGEEAFRFELIAEFQSRDELNAAESLHIEVSGSLYPNGYNLVKGGDVYERSEATREKLKNRKYSAETRTKISEGLKKYYQQLSEEERIRLVTNGKTIRAETRAKLSAINKGKPKSAAHRAKISEALRGKPKSAAHREKMSDAKKGKLLSAETRAKLSDARKKYWERRKQENEQ